MQYSSFENGFRDIYPRLIRTLTLISGEQELSRNIAKDSFARAYVKWKKINELENPEAWVRKVAIQSLQDEMIKKSKSKNADALNLDLTSFESIEKSLPSPIALDFARALIPMPLQQRIVATLSFVDNCSVNEIAQEMGISTDRVENYLHDAQKSFGSTLTGSIK